MNGKAVKRIMLAAVFFAVIISQAMAGRPKVNSVTMVPPNPDFGQVVTVTVDFCSNQQPAELAIAISSYSTRQSAGTGGQVFVVSAAGVDVPTVVFATDPINVVAFPGSGSGPYNCTDCSGDANSVRTVRTYTFRVPDRDMFPGCSTSTLYLHVGMKDDGGGIYKSEWQGLGACETGTSVGLPLSWNIPVPPKNFSIRKRVEGVLQAINDLVLFSIDYEYSNGQLVISDTLPGGGALTLIEVGPNPIPGGSVVTPTLGSATSGTITWTLPNKTGAFGKTTGTVWFLMRANAAIPAGTLISNTATGSMSGMSNENSTASIVGGAAAITCDKMATASTVAYGSNVTYILNYAVNGSQLKAYRAFDNLVTGTNYSTAGTPPPGWKYIPFNANYGSWTIRDDCGTGDKYLYGQSASSYGADQYPALLLDDPTPSNVQFCTGIIITDVMIDPVGFDGADALVILRSNGQSGPSSYAYALLLSIDTTPANGYLGIQKCGGGSCAWPAGTTAYQIVGNKWYRTKTQITVAGSNYVFNAKVWGRGDPEPTGWQLTWTDTGAATDANWRCDGSGNWNDWRPGVSEQHGANGDTRDSYDNFTVLIPRVSANTTLYDTVPAGILGSSVGGSGTPAATNPIIRWNLGSLSDVSGSYTWWGQVNSCLPITNIAAIDADDPTIPQYSNEVVIAPICPTPVITMYKTANVTQAFVGDTITFELWACNSAAGPLTADPFLIWDNVPGYISFVGFVGTPVGTGTSALTWSFAGGLAAGTCTAHVRWAGRVTGMPSIGAQEYFAVIPETKTIIAKAVCGE